MKPVPPSQKPEPAVDVRQWVTPEDLNVAPELLGLPLGTPLRRAAAMATDLAALALLVSLGNGWMLLGVGLLVTAAARVNLAWRRIHWAVWVGVAVLLALGAAQAWREPAARISAPVADIEATAEAAALRIEQLEAELAKANRSSTRKWQDTFAQWLDEAGLSYGWGLLYFATLSARWRGQTLGKRLFGLRVVELTGKPITFLQGVKRFGGYAAGMATGGLGFAQVLWDSNRQALHDKAAHTVVIDTRRTERLKRPQWQALPTHPPTNPPTDA